MPGTIATIKCFVPAQALEHTGNPERASRKDKLRLAILRYYQKKNFDALITVQDPMPYIFLKDISFNKDLLGYDVRAVVKVDKGVYNSV